MFLSWLKFSIKCEAYRSIGPGRLFHLGFSGFFVWAKICFWFPDSRQTSRQDSTDDTDASLKLDSRKTSIQDSTDKTEASFKLDSGQTLKQDSTDETDASLNLDSRLTSRQDSTDETDVSLKFEVQGKDGETTINDF